MTEQNTSFIDFLETHPARLASDSTKKWLAEFYLAGYATGERAAFTRGVKAMFDALLCRAANHFHADPKIQAQCDAENKLITDWAEDALEEVSPESCREWKSSEESYRSGYEAGERAARQECAEMLGKTFEETGEIQYLKSERMVKATIKEPT
jgi:hypothetical protein